MSAEQRAALADDHVTYDEYVQAFRRFQSCLKGKGYSLAILPEEHRVFEYGVPKAAEDAGADTACYVREFRQVDIDWQVANQDDSTTADAIRACLEKHGVTPDATLDDMIGQLQDAGLPLSSCHA